MKCSPAACVSAGIGSPMAILRMKETWKRAPAVRRKGERLDQLDDAERANVGAAMRVLKAKRGNWKALARALRVSIMIMNRLAQGHTKPTAGLALRLAKLAGVPVEDVLSGKYAKAEVCPHCGQVVPLPVHPGG